LEEDHVWGRFRYMGDHYPNTLKVEVQNLCKSLALEMKIDFCRPGNIWNEKERK
jgi:hypothetical protein